MPRTPSQNVVFIGNSRDADPYEPPGKAITESVVNELRERGYVVASPEIWRDCGWSAKVTVGAADLEIALTHTNRPDEWMLQIACTNDAGLVARLRGTPFVDRSEQLYTLSVAVYDLLAIHGFCAQRWCIDGFPHETKSTARPVRIGSV